MSLLYYTNKSPKFPVLKSVFLHKTAHFFAAAGSCRGRSAAVGAKEEKKRYFFDFF